MSKEDLEAIRTKLKDIEARIKALKKIMRTPKHEVTSAEYFNHKWYRSEVTEMYMAIADARGKVHGPNMGKDEQSILVRAWNIIFQALKKIFVDS